MKGRCWLGTGKERTSIFKVWRNQEGMRFILKMGCNTSLVQENGFPSLLSKGVAGLWSRVSCRRHVAAPEWNVFDVYSPMFAVECSIRLWICLNMLKTFPWYCYEIHCRFFMLIEYQTPCHVTNCRASSEMFSVKTLLETSNVIHLNFVTFTITSFL